jgi:hypothetical protein
MEALTGEALGLSTGALRFTADDQRGRRAKIRPGVRQAACNIREIDLYA